MTITETGFQVLVELVYFGSRHFDTRHEGFTHTDAIFPSIFASSVLLYWSATRARKRKSITLTSKCFWFGIQACISLGMANHHVWEDQMQNQTIFTHIRWIFKERPPFLHTVSHFTLRLHLIKKFPLKSLLKDFSLNITTHGVQYIRILFQDWPVTAHCG